MDDSDEEEEDFERPRVMPENVKSFLEASTGEMPLQIPKIPSIDETPKKQIEDNLSLSYRSN